MLGPDSFTTDGILKLSQANYQSTAQDAQILKTEPYTIDGLEGQIWEATGTINSLRAKTCGWCVSENGYCIQLLVNQVELPFQLSTSSKAPPRQVLTELSQGFSRIDRTRIAEIPGLPPATDYRSPSSNFTIKWNGKSWHEWDELADHVSSAEAGGISSLGPLSVSAFRLGGKPWNAEAIVEGLIGQTAFDLWDMTPLSRGLSSTRG